MDNPRAWSPLETATTSHRKPNGPVASKMEGGKERRGWREGRKEEDGGRVRSLRMIRPPGVWKKLCCLGSRGCQMVAG